MTIATAIWNDLICFGQALVQPAKPTPHQPTAIVARVHHWLHAPIWAKAGPAATVHHHHYPAMPLLGDAPDFTPRFARL